MPDAFIFTFLGLSALYFTLAPLVGPTLANLRFVEALRRVDAMTPAELDECLSTIKA